MVCIYCHNKTQIINSGHLTRINGTWRRRKCPKCSAVFTTDEVAQYDALWMIRDTTSMVLSSFKRDRLFLTVYDSCGHRKQAVSDSTNLTDTIIAKLGNKQGKGIIDITDLKQLTYSTLNRFDKAAGVHYLAYHGPL